MKLHMIVVIKPADPLIEAMHALRREVFVVAPIPHELEAEEVDEISTHVPALWGGRVIASGALCVRIKQQRSAGWRSQPRRGLRRLSSSRSLLQRFSTNGLGAWKRANL